MDAFGIASGLVAIHTRRKDNSFLEFVRRGDNPKSPLYTGFSKANGLPADIPGMTEAITDPKEASDRILKNLAAWAPPVPAPIDVKSVNWAVNRYHANWDGNQGASSRTLRVGRIGNRGSADGERAHPRAAQPVHRQPAAAAVSLPQRRPGACPRREDHLPRHLRVVSHAAQPDNLSGLAGFGTDRNRTLVDAGICAVRPGGAGHRGLPSVRFEQRRASRAPRGACPARGTGTRRLEEEYFRDTPRRVAEGTAGYKADMLHGIWAQAP